MMNFMLTFCLITNIVLLHKWMILWQWSSGVPPSIWCFPFWRDQYADRFVGGNRIDCYHVLRLSIFFGHHIVPKNSNSSKLLLVDVWNKCFSSLARLTNGAMDAVYSERNALADAWDVTSLPLNLMQWILSGELSVLINNSVNWRCALLVKKRTTTIKIISWLKCMEILKTPNPSNFFTNPN